MPRFKTGQSGNPGGRPKIAHDLKELARIHTHEALDTLLGVMRDKKAPHSSRVTAANAVLDRGYGKPIVSVETTISRFEKMSDEELRAWIATEAAELNKIVELQAIEYEPDDDEDEIANDA